MKFTWVCGSFRPLISLNSLQPLLVNRSLVVSCYSTSLPLEGMPASLGPGLRTAGGAKEDTRRHFAAARKCAMPEQLPKRQKTQLACATPEQRSRGKKTQRTCAIPEQLADGKKMQLAIAIAQGELISTWAAPERSVHADGLHVGRRSRRSPRGRVLPPPRPRSGRRPDGRACRRSDRLARRIRRIRVGQTQGMRSILTDVTDVSWFSDLEFRVIDDELGDRYDGPDEDW